jgi:hypothetical protein
MKAPSCYVCVLLLCVLAARFVMAQGETNEEFRVLVTDMDRELYDDDIIVVEKVGTTWRTWNDSTYVIPKDSFALGYGSILGWQANQSYGGTFKFKAHQWHSGEWLYPDSWMTWGKYVIYIGTGAEDSDEDGRYEFAPRDSFFFDASDQNWTLAYSGYADFFIDYDWDDRSFTLHTPADPDCTWYYTEDPTPVINGWQAHWIRPDNPKPRRTRYFTPQAPVGATVTAYNGHPKVTWRCNGESFDVKYDVYRALNGTTSFLDIADVLNTGYPTNRTMLSFVDYDLSGAGGGALDGVLLREGQKHQ